jgi:hypothetical protein
MRLRDVVVIPATAIGVMVLNVAISVGVVWVYSTLVEPGRPVSHYEAFAVAAAPVSSVVAGIPLMVLAGFFLSRGRTARAALSAAGAMALLYIVVDAAILLAADAGSAGWGWEALSYSTKLLSALAGAKLGAVRRHASSGSTGSPRRTRWSAPR